MSLRTQVAKYERKSAQLQGRPDEIEKIKLWYFQANAPLLPHDERVELTEGQEAKRKKLQEVWGLLINQPKEYVITYLSTTYNVSDRQAWNLISQAQELFGEIKKVNKQAERSLRIAQREAIIKLIKEDGTLEEKDRYALIDKFMEAIEKMNDLYKPDEMTTEEILDKLKLPDVVVSTDAQVLEQ